ncbi:hypothetical protein FWJ25_19270 [Marinobacter salinexigens]|uniref:Uncharacterized protein n=1 Tax=Marinobacter salinexigens TaxID=2919747 RepID=A0A5B0V501_9GAMM|nr:hypothetical protein FWJ25_19270 [Marinobacter salinexigens]
MLGKAQRATGLATVLAIGTATPASCHGERRHPCAAWTG